MNKADEDKVMARLDALEAENQRLAGALAAAQGITVQVAPTAEVDVIFTELAMATDAGPDGIGQRVVRGRPDGKPVTLRQDIAEAWIRRGKALRAGSAEADAWLKDKEAREAAAAAAVRVERAEGDVERKRQSALDDAAAAAAKKAEAA